ncbi:TonB-dependent receptor [Croceibacterium ferulae]|uniref:TonB-dependent receptor n=1 Tax=Croceibacterium ferulae TaxID=1854641 RepID=UPI001F4E731D|nr:TonB-dependent receptor [Croceibacterium ferulae]
MNSFTLRVALASMTALTCGVLIAPSAVAQVGQASLRGTITAPADNPAVSVAAVEVSSGIRRSISVGPDGSYNFASLGAGTYRLEITLQSGTVSNSDAFTLNVGQNAGLDIDLAAGTGAAADGTGTGTDVGTDGDTGAAPTSTGNEIVVTSGRIRELSGGQVGINITQRLIEQLPQNNRNFLAFADLAPGVRLIEGADGQTSIQGGAQRSNSVNVFIDGISQKDYVLKNGITGQDSTPGNPFPQLAIGEYQVLSSNYKAEFDQVSSVAITATTKSGTNEFHGEGFFDYTDQSLRSRRPTEIYPTRVDKVDTLDKQFGIALGGPIIQDVMHFFGSYEGKRQERPVDIQPGNGYAISSLPSQYQGLFGNFTNSFKEDLYFGKIDIVPTDADLVEFSVKYRDESGLQLSSGINTVSTGSLNRVEEWRGLGRWQHTEDNWINDFRVAYEDVTWAPTPNEFGNGQLFEATQRNGDSVARFGILRTGASANFQEKGQSGWTVQDDFTWTGFEGHTIKAGVKLRWIKLRTTEQNLLNPLYTYDVNLFGQDSFNDEVPYRLEFGAPGDFGTPEVQSDNFQLGLYIQDDWDVSDRLTLNIGIRWDYEETPAYLGFVTPGSNLAAVSPENYPNLGNAGYDINDYIGRGYNREAFSGAFQPRIGFTYRLDEDENWTVFGGYGRSYDRNQFDFLQQELSFGAFPRRDFRFIGQNSIAAEDCVASPTCIEWDPVYLTEEGRQQLLASNVVGGGRELRFINNDLKVPYSDQFSLGLRTRVADPVQLEVGYTHIQSRDGFAWLLGNRRPDGSFFFDDPASTTDVPGSPFGFAPAGYGSIILGTNGLETNADSVYAKVTKAYTLSSPWSVDATYTFTEAEENRKFGENFSLDYENIEDYPFLRSAGVPRHRFVVAGTADVPLGFSVSAKFQVESPLYLVNQVSTAVPFERTWLGGFRDGNGSRWGRRQLDMAVTKYVPLPFISDQTELRFRVDVINVLNDYNYTDFNDNPLDNSRTDGSSTIFGERTSFSIGGNPPRTVKLSAGFNF